MPSVLKILRSQVTKHISLVLTGNIFAAGLGFLSLLLISKGISINDFGLFNISLSLLVIAPIFTSFGIDTTMITHASSYLGKERSAQAHAVIKATLIFRIASSSVAGLIVFCLAPFLAKKIFHYPELASLLRLAAFGILFVSFFNHIKTTLYAYKRFRQYVMLLVLVDLVKLLAAFTLTSFSKMNAFSAVAVFSLPPLIGGLLGVWIIRKEVFAAANQVKKILFHLFPSSKWIFVSDAAKQTLPYVGTFMLAKILNSKAAGIYGLALNLTYIFPILINSFDSVILPEISRFQEISQFERYLKKASKIFLGMAGTALLCLLFSGKFILFFFGSRYADSIPIFNWFLFVYLIAGANSMTCSILYSLKKTGIVALTDVTRLTAMFLGCSFFISYLGITGPAILALILNTTAWIFLLGNVFRHIHRVKTMPLGTDQP